MPKAPRAHALVFASGTAALAWEALFQLRAALAIGVSAFGTALTLAATMGGMTVGALVMGRWLEGRRTAPWRAYAVLELVVGLVGLVVVVFGFGVLERLDGTLFHGASTSTSAMAMLVQSLGLFLVMAVPTAAMGATIPVFARAARASGTSLGRLYAINTLGAAFGTLALGFVLVPRLGVELGAVTLTIVNLVVALVAWVTGGDPVEDAGESAPAKTPASSEPTALRGALVVVGVTGLVAFGLEVAWFRALRASFRSTTDAFATMLVAVLVALALGARAATWLRARRRTLDEVLGAAGIAILFATPIVERADVLGAWPFESATSMVLARLVASLVVLGPPMALLGVCLPWILDAQSSPRTTSIVYATNTLGAIVGAIATAWLVLPALGVARASWLFGVVLVALAIVRMRRLEGGMARPAIVGGVALVTAIAFESGVGRTRVLGNFTTKLTRIVAFEEGVDATIAVVDTQANERMLFIDGFVATKEGAAAHYMRWMGRLPMLVHPAPKRALVICFGTGQTANALRRENPESLDIVDVSAGVFRMANHFHENEGVLDDPRVHAAVMDGRAWLRRTDHVYDVVTLEPMPPNFAGVNALYSLEFYQLVAARLAPGGVAAQWVPFHLLSIHDAVAIVATFASVFPDAFLWIDPVTETGIVVGATRPRDAPAEPMRALGTQWPGFARNAEGRNLEPRVVLAAIGLLSKDLTRYAELGTIITDDNQLLAYGPERYKLSFAPAGRNSYLNMEVVRRFQTR